MPEIELWEILLSPFYVALGLLLALTIQDKTLRRYFTFGLVARLLGGLAFFAIYLFYYRGGDTIAYFSTALSMGNLLLENPVAGFEVLFEGSSPENFSYFTSSTGYPQTHIYYATDTLATSKVITPLAIVSFRSYLLTTICMSILTFAGPWLLFKTLKDILPNYKNMLAISILAFPSALFWSSGISKDSLTFSATCLLVYGFYRLFMQRRIRVVTILLVVISFILILYIKIYILIVLVPSFIAWFFHGQMMRIKNQLLRIAVLPILLLLGVGLLAFLVNQFGYSLGEYSIDRVIDKAITSQEDLKRDYYGGNSFDIGTIENSFTGVLSKFPIATFFGCFGPTLIHVKNVVMGLSAVENTYFLALTLLVFVFRNPWKTLRQIFTNPFLTFCLFFCIMFGFAIGLTTSNFGALVRFKIPMVPFFNILLISLYFRTQQQET